MNEKITTYLRHGITALPALFAGMAANGFLTGEEAAKLDADLKVFLMSLAAVLAAALSRWVMRLIGEHAPHLSNIFGGGSGGNLPLWAMGMATAAWSSVAMAGALSMSSCAGLDGYDVDGQVAFIAADGAKGGLRFKKGEPTKGFLRVQTLDPETGKATGFADIEIAKKAKVVAEK